MGRTVGSAAIARPLRTSPVVAATARGVVPLMAGLLMAASVPPVGLWPAGIVGLGLLGWSLRGRGPGSRLSAGYLAGFGLFGPTLWWIGEIHLGGWFLLIPLEASFVALAALLAGGRTPLLLGPALVVGEAMRARWPFGGLPMGGVDLGQAQGPLASSARLGGALAVIIAAGLIGTGVASLVRSRHWPARFGGIVAVSLGVALPIAGRMAPAAEPGDGEPIRAALVQGGGVIGLRAIESDPQAVFYAHVATSGKIRRPVDLVLWPEDVVDVEGQFAGSEREAELAAVATELGATLVAGIVEDDGDARFRNGVVAWGPDGDLVARFDKVHRVPFGEWVPLRSLIERFADVSAIPRDAVVGTGDGVLRTPAGNLGVVISFEVFFGDRARAAVGAGGEVLLVPTNAASFETSQVPSQELAAARLRAWETDRWVAQAAPTGFSAILRPDGRVVARTGLTRTAVLHAALPRRSGLTPYARWGDWPLVALAVMAVATGLRRRHQARSEVSPSRRA